MTKYYQAMKVISDKEIRELGITPTQCVEWVHESFRMKYDAQLPPKISVHPQGIDFFTAMPCLLPLQYDRYGVKVVSRINGHKPALHSDLLLYQSSTGELLSLMDADWITQMRTGAVAALAINTLQKNDARVFSLVGLGSTAEATMSCLLATMQQNHIEVKLMRYKDQAERFAEKFTDSRVRYSIVETHEDLVRDTDVIVSAVTEMPDLFCPNETLYKPGVLVVPIHTRGFQNCDLCFDHVYADDRGHVEKFKFFNQFRQFNELSEVLLGTVEGRKTDDQRILAYNVGLGLHDVLFAYKIYKMIE